MRYNMSDFNTVGWAFWNDFGDRIVGHSKVHIIDGNGDTTLCGVVIDKDADASGCGGYGDCKRCAKIMDRMKKEEDKAEYND